MRARIQYDIDTLRKGSLVFDLMIIARTLAVVWRDQNAYWLEAFVTGSGQAHAIPRRVMDFL